MFRGRSVLLLGAAASGIDISVDLSSEAHKVRVRCPSLSFSSFLLFSYICLYVYMYLLSRFI